MRATALLHGSGSQTEPPSPERNSRHSIAVGHAEVGHRVENLARQLYLHALPIKGPTSHTGTGDRLVSVHGVLDQAAPAVTGRRVPLAPSEFSDRANVAIPLLLCGGRIRAELGITSRWDQHPYCSSFASPMGGFVNGLGVVRAVGGYRRNGVADLFQQWRDLSAVMRSASGQVRCHDLTCISVDSEVKLSPSPVPDRFLHVTDVNPASCTIDEYVDRPIGRKPAELNITEFLQSPRHSRMVRDWKVNLEEFC